MIDDILHIFFPREYTLENGKVVKEKFNWTPYITIAIILFSVFCAVFTKVDIPRLFQRSKAFWALIEEMIPPNWGFWRDMQKPMIDTIVMSVLGTVVGCLIALPMSFYLSSNFKLNKVYLAGHKGLLSLLRTLPTLVYAQLLSIVIGTGTLAGTISITIFTYTICVKMMYEQIETVDMGPYEALESTGASRVKCMMKAIYPQVRGFFWSTVLYCFETNVRSAAILGYVGAGGIGVQINEQLTWRRYGNTGLMVLVLVITVVIIETISRELRKKLVQG
ncbi:MAG TPA: phosphonate ABC transporter, permease protein PhnE [Erysipelotrichaceae bacterium]|nr:phosphonate ABC transporter, permease protein PhnE [Erysipelotrichaceae bacterium]